MTNGGKCGTDVGEQESKEQESKWQDAEVQ